MIVIFTAILIVVCIYTVIKHRRESSPDNWTPSKKSSSETWRTRDKVFGFIAKNDSGLLSEQSSMSDNNTLNNDEFEKETDDSELQEEAIEYTEMEIEEPPSFLNSQRYIEPTSSFVKIGFSKLRNFKKTDSDDEEVNDVFQKRKVDSKKRGTFTEAEFQTPDFDQRSSSSSELQTNRKPRKPRKPRNRRARNNINPFFNWKQKRDAKVEENSQSEEAGASEDTDDQVSVVEENQGGSAASSSTISDEPVRGKRQWKHIPITENEEKKPIPEPVRHEELQIAGVNVKFPVKPYPSQIAVMNKLIQGCKKQEHCLLESPTGSGKTLALLCGVLAWQEKMNDEYRQQHAEAVENRRSHFETEYGIEAPAAPSNSTNDPKSTNHENGKTPNPEEIIEVSEEEDSGREPELKKICKSTSPGVADGGGSSSSLEKKMADEKSNDKDDKMFQGPSTLKEVFEDVLPKKPPTIYYGSRTHKQIEQVIRELKKTAYSYKTMTILSSREFTCIQETDRNKTEVCTTLLDPTKGLGCRYYNEKNRNKISSSWALSNHGINGPWDIEDLVEIGRQVSCCPYFAARDMMVEAEIVFCPYNYLVDPNIRQSMQIQLEGQIVILDEAHNIEEMSRECGSLYFREDKILEIEKEAQALSHKRKHDFEVYNTIKTYLDNMLQFMRVNNLNSVDKFSDTSSSDFWTGVQLCELFNIHSLGKGAAKNFQSASAAAIMDFNTAKEEMAKRQRSEVTPAPVISQVGKKFLEDLTLALQMMESENLATDYRACIIESNVRDFTPVSENTWVSRGATTKRLRTLQMLCMNPAVIFEPLANLARSVILASGTLSPISSFQSELGTVFHHRLDANHVVPKESVYIRGIPCGPTGVQLKANYTNVNSWSFQDELGRLILDVCKVVPHGVLCFFSSYSMMQRQIDRWKQNSCWEKLCEVKVVLQEPRGSSNLEPVMQEFREIIQSTPNGDYGGVTGALLLAVFRGKVAEGIDFSDNEARCVMAIGIPYAVRKDPSVDMKFNYNNLNHSKGLLKGGEWYAVQAFRALNQALGRCVRHRNDWGAVLLVDQRFLERSNYNYLPKWVKTMWRDSPRFNLTQELEHFVATQIERMKIEDANSSVSEISKEC